MITFEHELRKEAIKRAVSGNRPLAETTTEVTKDAQLKEQFFTSPIALQPRLQGGDRKRTWNDRWNDMPDSWVDRNTWQRTSWKGKKGDKGRKGGSKGKRGGRVHRSEFWTLRVRLSQMERLQGSYLVSLSRAACPDGCTSCSNHRGCSACRYGARVC